MDVAGCQGGNKGDRDILWEGSKGGRNARVEGIAVISGQNMEARVYGRQDCREAFRESIKEEGRQ